MNEVVDVSHRYNMFLLWLMYLLLHLTYIQATFAYTKDRPCCLELPAHTHCRRVCKQLSPAGSVADQLHFLIQTADICHKHSDIFWKCINSSVSVLKEVDAWPGKICCDESKTSHCTESCNKAISYTDIQGACRQSEKALYSCMNKIRESSLCCQHGATPICRTMCRYLTYRNYSLYYKQPVLQQVCGSNNPTLLQCGKKVTTNWISPSQSINRSKHSLPCCEKAQTSQCKKTCMKVLVTMSEEDAIEELIQSCGAIFPSREPMWDCFLERSAIGSSNKKQGGHHRVHKKTTIYGAKLHCCLKAVSESCHNLCIGVYSVSWDNNWPEFEAKCLKSGSNEASIRSCLSDLEQPCKMGCDGLKFCENFNGRSTEMFQACHTNADSMAQRDIDALESGVVRLPHVSIPIKDIKTCEPEMWKAIVCTFQIKPCHSYPSPITICRADCEYILNKCVAVERLTDGHSVLSLCHTLSPDSDQSHCVSITNYTRPPPDASVSHVTNPCQSRPCGDNQVCLVNRHKCRDDDSCQPYICKSACAVGEVSSFLVARDTYVRLPVTTNHLQCHQACRCNHKGVLDKCTQIPCESRSQCVAPDRRVLDHGQRFESGCNVCVCYSAHIFCTIQPCPQESVHGSVLPCHCDERYRPVCARNGMTYASPCHAKCAGFSPNDYYKGQCSGLNPCTHKPCQRKHKCLPRPIVCLGTSFSTCKQHYCVKEKGWCSRHEHTPVCDTAGHRYNNPCTMIHHRSDRPGHQRGDLAYFGRCETACSSLGPVCGYDKITYRDECASWAAGVAADYPGGCRSAGLYAGQSGKKSNCDRVTCAPVVPESCVGITPPGACCSVCGVEIRAAYDKELANHIASIQSHPLTVRQVVTELSTLMSVAECRLFGYLDVRGDIIFIIRAISQHVTIMQVVACQREATHLHHLISTSSPIIQTRLALSPLLVASIRQPRTAPVYMPLMNTSSRNLHPSSSSHILLIVLMTVLSSSSSSSSSSSLVSLLSSPR